MAHFASVFGASVSLFNLLGWNEVHSLTHINHSIIVRIILITCFHATRLENAVLTQLFLRSGADTSVQDLVWPWYWVEQPGACVGSAWKVEVGYSLPTCPTQQWVSPTQTYYGSSSSPLSLFRQTAEKASASLPPVSQLGHRPWFSKMSSLHLCFPFWNRCPNTVSR